MTKTKNLVLDFWISNIKPELIEICSNCDIKLI
jgi:hypothetical protein